MKNKISTGILLLALLLVVAFLFDGDSERKPEDLTKKFVSEKIIGIWQNEENKNFTVEFTEDFRMIENLSPTQIDRESQYRLTDFDDGPDGVVDSPTFNRAGVYIEQTLDGSPFYYKIIAVDESGLKLFYLNLLGELDFIKLRELE